MVLARCIMNEKPCRPLNSKNRIDMTIIGMCFDKCQRTDYTRCPIDKNEPNPWKRLIKKGDRYGSV